MKLLPFGLALCLLLAIPGVSSAAKTRVGSSFLEPNERSSAEYLYSSLTAYDQRAAKAAFAYLAVEYRRLELMSDPAYKDNFIARDLELQSTLSNAMDYAAGWKMEPPFARSLAKDLSSFFSKGIGSNVLNEGIDRFLDGTLNSEGHKIDLDHDVIVNTNAEGFKSLLR